MKRLFFRNNLFNAFQYWFNNKTWLSSVVVSVIFAIMHTQYGSAHVADAVSCVAGFDHRQNEKQRPADAGYAAYSDERDGYSPANGGSDVTAWLMKAMPEPGHRGLYVQTMVQIAPTSNASTSIRAINPPTPFQL